MRKKEKSIGAAMYSFTGRVFPPMRRPLHLILHHLAVHLNVSTGGNLPPQLSDAGCERLYLLRIIGRGSFTLPAIERPALRRKSAIFSLQIFFVSQQFVKRCVAVSTKDRIAADSDCTSRNHRAAGNSTACRLCLYMLSSAMHSSDNRKP